MIIDAIYQIIKERGGQQTADAFLEDCREFIDSGLSTIPPSDQIRKMNAYWIDLLSVRPGTVNVRNWIQDIDDVNEYLEVFREDWCHLLLNTGVYSGE